MHTYEVRSGGFLFDDTNRDVTDTAISHLFDECGIAEGVVLRDLLLLMNRDLPVYNAILGNWCKEFVEEGLQPFEGETDKDIEYLELYWWACIDTKWEGPLGEEVETDKRVISQYTFPSFHGVGFADPSGKRTNYGVDFSCTSSIARLPVRLNRGFVLYDEILENRLRAESEVNSTPYAEVKWDTCITRFDDCAYSLGQILQGLLWEMSFYGPPKERDATCAEVKGSLEEAQAYQEKE